MEQEATNTLLGLLNLPSWLEVTLAISSVGFLLYFSWIKSKKQNQALEALEESCRVLSASARESILQNRNIYEAIKNRLETTTELNEFSADQYVTTLINAIYYQVVNFNLEMTGEKPHKLVDDFCSDCHLEFCKSLAKIQVSNGKRLADFGAYSGWYFTEKLRDKIIYCEDAYQPAQFIRNQLEKEWGRWK